MKSLRPLGRARTARNGTSPTRERLIAATLELMQHYAPEAISTDMVLQNSGASKGSLYHHFEDLSDLLETALIRQFTQTVDHNIEMMSKLLSHAHNKADLYAAAKTFTEVTQAPERRDVRFNRAGLLSLAPNNPRFAAKLAEQQTRLTDAYTQMFEDAQMRGLMDKDFDARAGAVLVQAYTLGRIVDDVVDNPVDPQDWNALLMKLVARVFGVVSD